MSRFPVYRDYEMIQPTAQSWETREPTLPPQFVPTYQATDLRFKRFLDDVLATNYIPTCHKAADLRFKIFLEDILASRNQGNPAWLENLTLSYAKNRNYYYQFQL